MVILDKYDDVIVHRDKHMDPGYFNILIGVDSNTDPIISDIASEINQDTQVFYNGFYGLILDMVVGDHEGVHKILLKTRRIDR